METTQGPCVLQDVGYKGLVARRGGLTLVKSGHYFFYF